MAADMAAIVVKNRRRSIGVRAMGIPASGERRLKPPPARDYTSVNP
jgi:hypothetical protein